MGGIELGLQSIAEKAIFGRAPTCDVPVEHLSISRQHAVLSTDTAGNLYLMDMGSGRKANDLLYFSCVVTGHIYDLRACQWEDMA